MNVISSTYKKGNAKLKEKIDKNGAKYAKKQESWTGCRPTAPTNVL